MINFKAGLLITGLFFPLMASPATAAQPSLNFSPSAKTVEQNETFTIDVLLDTAGYDVGGAGAKINYDPAKLSVTKIVPGTIFADYPALIIDSTGGKLTISGISASLNQLYNGRGVLATIWLKTKNSGETTADFNFQPGSTTDSNIAVTFGNGDILAAVNQLRITVQASGQNGGTGEEESLPSPPPPGPAPANNLGGWINRWFAALDLPAPFPDQSSRAGRPEAELDADQPLTQQAPITDPDQSQPENSDTNYVSQAKPTLRQWLVLPEVYLTAAGISSLAAGYVFFRFKIK